MKYITPFYRKGTKLEVIGKFVIPKAWPKYRKRITAKVQEVVPDAIRIVFCGNYEGGLLTVRIPGYRKASKDEMLELCEFLVRMHAKRVRVEHHEIGRFGIHFRFREPSW